MKKLINDKEKQFKNTFDLGKYEFGIPNGEIIKVSPGGQGEKVGLQIGWIISEVNGERFTPEALFNAWEGKSFFLKEAFFGGEVK